ncbi:MAG: hypothetical protein ACYSSI_08050 [Planctomycetota bacterium]|jgi:hypothetical protein
MKNSKEYSKKVQSLYRSLKSSYPKAKKVTYECIADALVYGCLSEYLTESAAKTAMKGFEEYFVDVNDLRVSHPEEIIELLGKDRSTARAAASTILKSLQAVFYKYNTIDLEPLRKMGKKPAKQVFNQLVNGNQFIVDYCMLTALGGHAIPLTQAMLEYLRGNEIVHPEADEQTIEGFLVKQISAKNGYDFYALLRKESESKRKKVAKKTGKKKKAAVKSQKTTRKKKATKEAKKKKK